MKSSNSHVVFINFENISPKIVFVNSYSNWFSLLFGMQRQKTGSDDDSNHVCLKFCSGMDGVLSVFPNRYHKLHTTKSWDFIGLPQTARRNVKRESNIIVGLLDTGSIENLF